MHYNPLRQTIHGIHLEAYNILLRVFNNIETVINIEDVIWMMECGVRIAMRRVLLVSFLIFSTFFLGIQKNMAIALSFLSELHWTGPPFFAYKVIQTDYISCQLNLHSIILHKCQIVAIDDEWMVTSSDNQEQLFIHTKSMEKNRNNSKTLIMQIIWKSFLWTASEKKSIRISHCFLLFGIQQINTFTKSVIPFSRM